MCANVGQASRKSLSLARWGPNHRKICCSGVKLGHRRETLYVIGVAPGDIVSIVATVMTPRRSANPYRVLLVEDDRATVRLVREVLRNSARPFDVSDVGTLEEAMEALEDGRPDIIVLDLGLPDVEGLDGLKTIRNNVPDIPVIVLTSASASDDIAVEVLRAGAQEYLSKVDDDWEQLGRTIGYAIERHGVNRALHSTTEQLRAANERLELAVRRDPLTGLLNRRGLAGVLPAMLARAHREGLEVFALMADLDDFGQVNERLGYSVGDMFMREIARRVLKNIGPDDHAARLGGDELMILMLVDKEAHAWHVAERVRLELSSEILVLRDGSVRVTGSFALVPLGEQHMLLDRVMAMASEALQISKKLGKNRISGQSPDALDDQTARNIAIVELTDPAQFHHVSEPIVRLNDQRVVGHEYLARFESGPYEQPSAFLRLASGAGVETTVDHNCLRSGLEAARAAGHRTPVHIDVLPLTLVGLPTEHLDELLEGFAPEQVCFELSQRYIASAEDLIEAVGQVRKSGARLGLDDVGFGRSSLESLVHLEPATIKLDPRCTQAATSDRQHRQALERLLAVLSMTGAEVIAQGVGTEAERDLLIELGVTRAQGPLWG